MAFRPAKRTSLEAGLLAAVASRQTTAVCCVVTSRQTSRLSRRQIHTTPQQQDVALTQSESAALPVAPTADHPTQSSIAAAEMPALSYLPLSQILRTYLITSMSSSPRLLAASTSLLRLMLESKAPLFNIERNPILRAVLWETFYKQFCAGSTQTQIQKMCGDLRSQGYSGVILEYALEVLKDAEGDEVEDVATWRKGLLDTIDMATPGDFVGLKWSGMGPAAMRRMKDVQEPSKAMQEAMDAVCQAAANKNVSLLPAAEETWSLDGFFDWCLRCQRVYNLNGKSVVYSTYQAYLKSVPATLAKHLDIAKQEGFTLGAKLVRGAYLGSEQRSLIQPSIEATHEAYDSLASALIQRRPNAFVRPTEKWPQTNIMLATHNAISVSRAQSSRRAQVARGEPLTPLAFAQLQGMADEVSCTLIAAAKAEGAEPKERVFKCTTWGTMYQCLNYLLRRAAENKDAASRTSDTRRAMQGELGRRLRASVGLA